MSPALENRPLNARAILDDARYLRRYRRRVLMEQGALLCAHLLGWFLVVLLPAAFVTGSLGRQALVLAWAAGWGAAGWRFWNAFKSAVQPDRFRIWLEHQSPLFRDLLSAAELSRSEAREGISRDLTDQLVFSVQSVLDRESASRWVDPPQPLLLFRPALLLALVAASLFLAPPQLGRSAWTRLVFGHRLELARHVKISPEGARVPYGEPAEIAVELLRETGPAPRLRVQGPDGWEDVAGETEGRVTRFVLRAVTEEVRYKVQWKHMESFSYVLVPVEPPRLENFKTVLSYPDYTGQAPQTLEGEPRLQAARGSRMDLSARSTKPLSKIDLLSSDGLKHAVQVENKRDVRVSITVNNPFEFWFEMTDEEGVSPTRPVRYAVTIKEDEAPVIRLIAPDSDLMAGRESRIPFTWDSRDDLGVAAVYMRVEKQGSSRQRFILKRYDKAVSEKLDGADFNLGQVDAAPGDVLKLQLEAQDNDRVSGPKSGFSDTILVEVQSYERDHQRIEEELKAFRKDLLDLLADQTLAQVSKEEWKKLAADPQAMSRKMEETLEKQNRLSARTEQLENKLDKTLQKMDRDPLSDLAQWSEHQALRDGLERTRKGAMRQAEQSLERKDAMSSAEQQEEAVAQLERLSALSEDVHKYGKMRDLMHAADRLEEKGRKLTDELSEGKASDNEALQMLQDTLKEAMDLMAEIASQIKDLPQELPEEFVNQAAVKNMDMDRMAESAQKLSQALRNRDFKSALREAQEFLKQVKAARDALSKASEGVSPSGSGNMSGRVQEQESALQKIADQQEKLLERTGRMEAKRRQSIYDNQRKVLADLAVRQEKVLRDARKLNSDLRSRVPFPAFVSGLSADLQAAFPPMEKVLNEFKEQNVIFSQKWLEEIGGRLSLAEKNMEIFASAPQSVEESTAAASPELETERWGRAQWERLHAIRAEEQAILDVLRNPPTPEVQSASFSQEDQAEMKRLSQEQDALSDSTRKFRNDLNALANDTALVGQDILDDLKGAQSEMKGASGSLEQSKTEEAQSSQQKALSYLRKSQDSLQQARQKIGQTQGGGNQGGGQPGFVQPRNAQGGGGSSGIRTGAVRIPRAEDYLPPRQFREELLESLKEKYPKSEEETIKDYYRRLSQ